MKSHPLLPLVFIPVVAVMLALSLLFGQWCDTGRHDIGMNQTVCMTTDLVGSTECVDGKTLLEILRNRK